MKKLVLAYSGGLDTSYCVKHLSQLEYEVHAVGVNTGGFDAEEVKSLSAKAMSLGATSYESIDAVDTFYQKVIRFFSIWESKPSLQAVSFPSPHMRF